MNPHKYWLRGLLTQNDERASFTKFEQLFVANCGKTFAALPSPLPLAIDEAMSFAPQSLNARLQAAQGYLGLNTATSELNCSVGLHILRKLPYE